MKKSLLLIFLVVVVFLYVIHQKDEMMITGLEHTYRIPEHYQSSGNGYWLPGQFAGDNAAMISLEIPKNEFDKVIALDAEVLRLQIFFDRNYSFNDLHQASKNLADNPNSLKHIGDFYVAEEAGKGYIKKYFFSFNPFDNNYSPKFSDYYLIYNKDDAWNIGETIIPSKESYHITLTRDGLLIHLSWSEKKSDFKNHTNVINFSDDLLASWRRDQISN